MTRDEATKHLQIARTMLLGGDNQPVSDLYYALDVAIEALKQGDVLQEIREEIRKDAEWWSERDSLREQVLRDVIEDIIDKHIAEIDGSDTE